MIVDSISNHTLYHSLGPRIASGLEFLAGLDLSEFVEGRRQIDGDDVFALFQATKTAGETGRRFEAHRTHIDIQFVVSGEETIRVTDVALLKEATPYNLERDIAFYDLAPGSTARLRPGDFALLFPHDAHLPLLPTNAPGPVRKVVVKVRV
jgi:YhcH/YjgK/YiaL family protein